MFTPLSFGDVFTMDDKEYIYFAQGEDITYAARILDRGQSAVLDGMFNSKYAQGKNTNTNVIYCYVKLKTADFKDRCALVSHSGLDIFGALKKQEVLLVQADLDQLKDEILNGKGASGELKEIIKNDK